MAGKRRARHRGSADKTLEEAGVVFGGWAGGTMQLSMPPFARRYFFKLTTNPASKGHSSGGYFNLDIRAE